MKNIFLLAVILVSGQFSMAQFSSAHLTAAGLTCALCTKAIYNALSKVPGVEKVDADIKNSGFDIQFKKGSAVDPDQLKNAVQNAGFSVSKFQLTGNFQPTPLSQDAHIDIGHKMFHFVRTSKKTLEGTQTLTVVDKDYIGAREFKKYASSTAMACIRSGKQEACCDKYGIAGNTRIYHVTL